MPRYNGPIEVIKVVGKAAYQLQLPAQLSEVHDVFHVSMLRKCLSDATPVVKKIGRYRIPRWGNI